MGNDLTFADKDSFTLTEATAVFPRKNGKKIHFLTVRRWITQGYRGIRLQATKSGDRWEITRAAIEKFQADCTAKAIGQTETTPIDARADAAEARAFLRRRGFYRDGTDDANGKKQEARVRKEARVLRMHADRPEE